MKTVRLVAVLLVTIAAWPVAAHHSFSAEYDFNKPLKLKGKVTEMKWANPHAWIYIDVVGKDGKAVSGKVSINSLDDEVKKLTDK